MYQAIKTKMNPGSDVPRYAHFAANISVLGAIAQPQFRILRWISTRWVEDGQIQRIRSPQPHRVRGVIVQLILKNLFQLNF